MSKQEEMRVENIEIKKIRDNPYQPRKSYPIAGIKLLAKSISQRGLLHPISVVKSGKFYVIVGGHRRLRAFKKMRRKIIPCIVRRQSKARDLALDLAIENAIRKDFSPIEKAHAILTVIKTIKNVKNDMLRAYTLISQLKLANKRGISKVTNKKGRARGFREADIWECERLLSMLGMSENTGLKYLRLLTLPGSIQDKIIAIASNEGMQKRMISEGYITVTMGYEISRIADDRLRLQIYERAVKNRWNSITLKAIVDDLLENNVKSISELGSSKRRGKEDYGIEFLTNRCWKLSSSLWNFRKLIPQVKLRFEKIVFKSSLRKLRKGALELIKSIDAAMDVERGIKIINNEEELIVNITKASKGSKWRWTFPMKVGRSLDLKPGDQLRLKITGIKRRKK